MTENQWKEFSKYFLDNGNSKLSEEEKERIKLAIDQADNLNELLQVAVASFIPESLNITNERKSQLCQSH